MIKRIKPEIKRKSASEVLGPQRSVQLIEIDGRDGNASLLELFILNHYVKALQPNAIFEIGTFDGRTSLNFALNSAPQTKIYTLDLPKDEGPMLQLKPSEGDRKYITMNVTGARFKNKGAKECSEKNKVIQLFGDSANFDYSPYENKIDFVFIDGAHSYDYLINDTQVAFKLLRNGKGIIIWHDYDGAEGVTKGLNQIQRDYPELSIFHVEGTSMCVLDNR